MTEIYTFFLIYSKKYRYFLNYSPKFVCAEKWDLVRTRIYYFELK